MSAPNPRWRYAPSVVAEGWADLSLEEVLTRAYAAPTWWEQFSPVCCWFHVRVASGETARAQALLEAVDVGRVFPPTNDALLSCAKRARDEGLPDIDHAAFFARVLARTPQAFARDLYKRNR